MGCIKFDILENQLSTKKTLTSKESDFFTRSTYLFGFNGMEKDPEITGQQGSHYTAAFWEYDTRIARRWNLDPVDKPWESSYLAFSGNPILLGDPNGDNADWFQNEKTGKVFYHPELREGDEGTLGMEGEGWVHMGENGMFGVDFSGSPPENMINPGEYGTGSDWSHIHESGSGTWLYDFRAVNPDDSEFVWENKFEGVLFTPEEASEFMGDHGYEFKATTRVISEGHHNTIAETQHLDYSGESIISVSDYRYINYKGYWNKDYYLGSNHPTADTRSQNVQYSDRYREKLEKSKKRTGNIFMRLIAEVVKVFKK